MTFYGQIYKITYPDDPHYYYGQTTKTLRRRLTGHMGRAFNGSLTDLSCWLRDRPDVELVEIINLANADTLEELDDLEDQYIGDLWKTDPNCLNMQAGGLGYKNYGEDGRSNSSMFTYEQVEDIKDQWVKMREESDGYNSHLMDTLADDWGCSSFTIKNILTGKNYNPNGKESLVEMNTKESARKRAKAIRDFDKKYPWVTHREIGEYFDRTTGLISGILRNIYIVDQDYEPRPRSMTKYGKDFHQKIRLYAEANNHLKGSEIAKHLKVSSKYCRSILRNQVRREENWDPETWTYR